MSLVTGHPPEQCQRCHGSLATAKVVYDCSVRGMWGWTCHTCFRDNRCMTGMGLGQKYRKALDGRWIQIAGGFGARSGQKFFNNLDAKNLEI